MLHVVAYFLKTYEDGMLDSNAERKGSRNENEVVNRCGTRGGKGEGDVVPQRRFRFRL